MKKNFHTAAEGFLSKLDASNRTANTFPVQKIAPQLTSILQLQDEPTDEQENTRLMKNAKEKKRFLSKVSEWISAKHICTSAGGEIFHTLVDKCISLYDSFLKDELLPYPNNIQQLRLRQENAFKLMEGKYPFRMAPLGYSVDRKTAILNQNEESSDDLSQILVDQVATGKILSEKEFITACEECGPQITTNIIIDKLFEQESDRSWLMLAGCFQYPSHGIHQPIPYTTSPYITLAELWQIVQHIYSKKKRGNISYDDHLQKYATYIHHLRKHYPDRWEQTGQANIDFLDEHISAEDDNQLPGNLVSAGKTTLPTEYILSFKQANAFFKDGHYKEALALYREASRICPHLSAPEAKIQETLSLLRQNKSFKDVATEIPEVYSDAVPEEIAKELKNNFTEEEDPDLLSDGEDKKESKRKSKKKKK